MKKVLSILLCLLMLLSMLPVSVLALESGEAETAAALEMEQLAQSPLTEEQGTETLTEDPPVQISQYLTNGEVALNETNFPDANFLSFISSRFDKDDNGSLSAEELAAVTVISCDSCQITSLQGIEYFTALKELDCGENQLTALDLSNNTSLISLDCGSNSLTDLDVSRNTALVTLHCHGNQLTSLDLSENTALILLSCSDNNLTALDVSPNTLLTNLYCFRNQLTSLDVSMNTSLTDLDCSLQTVTMSRSDFMMSSDGYCITIGGVEKAFTEIPSSFTAEVPVAGSSELMSICVTVADSGSPNVAINEINFPDDNFRSYVSSNCDSNSDNILTTSELSSVTALYCFSKRIASLKGVEFFPNLKELYCFENQLTELDVSHNTALTTLNCYQNQLTELDISKNSALTTLNLNYNNLTALNVSGSAALTSLSCSRNGITSLELSQNTALTYLNCSANRLTALDVSNNTMLEHLDCRGNYLTALDLSENAALDYLDCDSNQLTELDASEKTALTHLSCGNNSLTSLNVSNDTALRYLYQGPQYLTCSRSDFIADSNGYTITIGGLQQTFSYIPDGFSVTLPVIGRTETMDVNVTVRGLEAGDMDGNGFLNLEDVSLLYRCLIGILDKSDDFERLGDVNTDGLVNLRDVAALFNRCGA